MSCWMSWPRDHHVADAHAAPDPAGDAGQHDGAGIELGEHDASP
jgi:hypothetical protein